MNTSEPKYTQLWRVSLPVLLLANLTYLTHNVFGWSFTLVIFLYLPGYLLLKSLLNPEALGIAKVSLSIGLSLTLLTMSGLALNCLHFIGIARPLQTTNIFVTLDIMVLILLFVNRSAYIRIPTRLPRINGEEWLFCFFFSLLPVLSVFGAIRLNNGASNILTMLMIALVGLLYLALIIRPTMNRIYPYVIFMTALAFLFSISLRGWFITGHDIHHEYNVFNSVIKLGYWSPSSDRGDPYNACLSITILPTILAKITNVTMIYIYKVVYQVVFASIVPVVYIIAKKFVPQKQALLGAFAFITFPTFINDLPFLNRQEVAFGYFILIIYVNLSTIANRAKSILTVFLLLIIILSHYSTSYVTISVLLLALLVYKLLSLFYKNTTRLNIPLLSLPIIVMAFLATFVWNAQITSSSSNLSSTLKSAVNGILGKNEATVSSYRLVPNAIKTTPAQQLAQTAVKKNAIANYAPADVVPLTALGKQLSKFTDVTSLNTLLHGLIARLLQIFVIFGTILMLFYYRKKPPKPKEIYVFAIGISFLTALVLFTFVPQLSAGYDVTRLFQQSLTVLWLPVIFFCTTIFTWLGKYRLIASAGLLVLIYLSLSGFTPQLTGGYLPNLALNNSGLYYDFFYTHKSDEIGTEWLAGRRLTYMTVFVDSNAATPPLKYPIAVGLIGGRSQGYYYTDYSNNTTGRYRTILSSGFAEYTSSAFTNKKDTIYSNGKTNINFTWPMTSKN